MIRTIDRTLLGALVIGALGCAHTPAPNDQLANSQAAIRGAEEAGAMANPQAALQVKLAEEELAQARKLVEKGDNQRAEDRALRASNDAELARVIAHAASTEQRLTQMSPLTSGSSSTSTTSAP